MARFFGHLGRSIARVFSGRNFLWHVLAYMLTAVLVVAGVDWWFFGITRGPVSDALGLSAGMLGFVVPVVAPVSMWAIGALRKDVELRRRALVLLEAIVVAWIVIAVYKAVTGRVEPEFLAKVAESDRSRGFHFGFLRYGVFWGWPSAHTGVAFATASCVAGLYRTHRWVKVIVFAYALFIAIGAAVSFHWLSDVVAGLIIGSLVGGVVFSNPDTQLSDKP